MNIENMYYYTPWEEKLVSSFKNVEKNVIIVCPFIKTPIIKKIISKIAYKDVQLTLVTRFTKQVFSQKSSDIEVIDILLSKNLMKITPLIYMLNNVHAKIFILDDNMFITSSNLTYSGLNKNYEICINIKNKVEVDKVKREISGLCKTLNLIKKSDLEEMSRYYALENQGNFSSKNFDMDEDVVEQNEVSQQFVVSQLEYDEFEDALDDNESERDITTKINKYLIDNRAYNYNKIEQYDFKSTQEFVDKSRMGDDDKEALRDFILEHAVEDRKVVREKLNKTFNLYLDYEYLNNIFYLFSHKSWLNAFYPEETKQEYIKFYSNAGKYLHKMIVLEKLMCKKFFSDDNVGFYHKISDYIIGEYPYREVMSDIGLNFILTKGDLKKNESESEHFRSVLAYIYMHAKNIDFKRMYDKYFSKEDAYIYDSFDAILDYKSTAQFYTQQEYRRLPEYRKTGSEGTCDKPVYYVDFMIYDKCVASGKGGSIKDAEQDAAKNYLQLIKAKGIDISLRKASQKKLSKYMLSVERKNLLEQLSSKYEFFSYNMQMLDIALTHKSIINEMPSRRANSRIALLGSYVDRVCLFIINKESYSGWVDAALFEKTFKMLGISPVSVYPQLFDRYELSKYVDVVKNVKINDKMKVEIIQSLIAYIYLNRGISFVIEFIKESWLGVTSIVADKLKHPMAILLEELQEKCGIQFDVDYKQSGPPHKCTYKATIRIDGKLYGSGEAASKKSAKLIAANNTLNSDKYRLFIDSHKI